MFDNFLKVMVYKSMINEKCNEDEPQFELTGIQNNINYRGILENQSP